MAADVVSTSPEEPCSEVGKRGLGNDRIVTSQPPSLPLREAVW